MRNLMRTALQFTFVVALMGLLNSVASAGEKTGLENGAKAPAFTLKDQAGKERSLDEFLKKDKIALVFYRSANW